MRQIFCLLLLLRKLLLLNSSLIRKYITFFSTRFTDKICQWAQNITTPRFSPPLPPTKKMSIRQEHHDNFKCPSVSYNIYNSKNIHFFIIFYLDRTHIQQEFKLICKGWTSLSQTNMCGRFPSWSVAAGSLSNAKMKHLGARDNHLLVLYCELSTE